MMKMRRNAILAIIMLAITAWAIPLAHALDPKPDTLQNPTWVVVAAHSSGRSYPASVLVTELRGFDLMDRKFDGAVATLTARARYAVTFDVAPLAGKLETITVDANPPAGGGATAVTYANGSLAGILTFVWFSESTTVTGHAPMDANDTRGEVMFSVSFEIEVAADNAIARRLLEAPSQTTLDSLWSAAIGDFPSGSISTDGTPGTITPAALDEFHARASQSRFASWAWIIWVVAIAAAGVALVKLTSSRNARQHHRESPSSQLYVSAPTAGKHYRDPYNPPNQRQTTIPEMAVQGRGHVKLVNLNKKRSKRARTLDGRQTARRLFRKPTDENIAKWAKDPGHSDFLGIDNEGRHAGTRTSSPFAQGKEMLRAQTAFRPTYTEGRLHEARQYAIRDAMVKYGATGPQVEEALKGIDAEFAQLKERLERTGNAGDGQVNSAVAKGHERQFSFAKIRPLLKDSTDVYKMNYAELTDYQDKCGRGLEMLWVQQRSLENKIKLQRHKGQKWHRGERAELKRIKAATKRLVDSGHEAYKLRLKRQKYAPKIVDLPPVKDYNTIDAGNMKLIEAAQAIRYAKQDREVAREYAGGVDVVKRQRGAISKKRKYKDIDKESVTLSAQLPGSGFPGTHELTVHTHPARDAADKTVNPVHMWPRKSPQGRAGIAKQIELQDEATSISWDDRPSAQDIKFTAETGKPHLLVTPRRNILMVPGKNAKSPDKDKLREDIIQADAFALTRSGARFPRSLRDAKRRLRRYEAEREDAIAGVIASEAGVDVTYYKKGKKIKYPRFK